MISAAMGRGRAGCRVGPRRRGRLRLSEQQLFGPSQELEVSRLRVAVEQVANLAREMVLVMKVDGTVLVDGVDATIEIRGPEVTRAVSLVAANAAVRSEMRSRQREWANEHGGGVMEGRDIGTVVFPDARLKVYLDASPEIRAERRSKEVSDLSYESVASDIARRDALDQNRAHDPLTVSADARVIDTSHLGVEEIVDQILELLA